MRWFPLPAVPAAAAFACALACAAPGPTYAQNAAPVPPPQADTASIVAVVNGDVISRQDVEDRRRLFALSSGLPISPDVLNRLTPQITRQLIDEKLRLQEIERRQIVVSGQDIAKAISEIESRNGMPPGTLRKRLEAAGIGMRTLIDQIRVQIGWTRVLHQVLGPRVQVTDAEIAEQMAVLKSEIGQTEYQVGEIFIPIENPQASADAQKFADLVIQQLRNGVPFAVAATQFSQSETALAGGDLGWVQPDSLDPAVVSILARMPIGAISDPVRVPGGIDIVTLRGKREIGRDMENILTVRQAFVPFTAPLNPQAPTDQQKQALADAQHLSATATSCDDVEAANKRFGGSRPADPGPIQLNAVPEPMHNVLASLQPGRASKPLVARDGIAVVMICSSDAKPAGLPTKEEMGQRILAERIELTSRQLQRDLRRRAMIQQRGA